MHSAIEPAKFLEIRDPAKVERVKGFHVVICSFGLLSLAQGLMRSIWQRRGLFPWVQEADADYHLSC
jgi:hypothetical protein